MELRHLRHFSAVVELGNLSRAADRVHISQPALTRSIKTLEDIVGAQLLERRPRGVVPTPAGEALHHYAKLLLNEAARARAEVTAVSSGGKGRLAIGIAAMFADHIVDRAVHRITAGAADVNLAVEQGFLEELVDALNDGRLDLIFSNLGEASLLTQLAIEPLFDIEAYIYVGAGHPLAGQDTDRKRLLSQRWVTVDQPHMRVFLDRYFSADDLPAPATTVRTNSLDLIRSLLAGGNFVALMPQHIMARREREGAVVRLDAPGMPIIRRAGIIMRQDSATRPLVATFNELLREECTRMAMQPEH